MPNREIEMTNFKMAEESHVEDGPMESRQCTDIFCCLLFCLNVTVFVGISVYAYVMGQPGQLLGIYNDQGMMCSKTAQHLAYIPEIMVGNFTAVCVETCPNSPGMVIKCLGSICSPNITSQYGSIDIGNLVCIPNPQEYTMEQTVNSNLVTRVFSDIKVCWPIFLGSVAASVLLGFVYFVFLRVCAGIMVWLSLLVAVGGTLAIGIYMYLYTKGIKIVNIPYELTKYTLDQLQYTSYFLWFISLVAVLVIIFCWNRIRLAIAIAKTTSTYLSETLVIILVPPFMTFLTAVVLALILAGFFFIFALGNIVIESPFAYVQRSQTTQYLMYYQIFGGIWTLFFTLGFSQFVLCSAAVIWYFNQDMKPHRPITSSLWRAFRYHIGSIAFGSLILALLAIMRAIISLLKFEEPVNKCAHCCWKIANCLLNCLNSYMKYVTKSAYVQIAITGKNFCASAAQAIKITLNNPLRMAINAGLISGFMVIGKAAMTCLIAVAAYYCVMKIEFFAVLIASPIAPTIICAIIAYVISSIFMSIFGCSANAIMHCFLVDETVQASSGKPAIYCPEALREIIMENLEKTKQPDLSNKQ